MDDIERFEKLLRAKLQKPEQELQLLIVDDGTFDGFEVYLGKKATVVSSKRFQGALRNDTLEGLAQSVYDTLTTRCVAAYMEYDSVEVVHKLASELERIIVRVWGEENLKLIKARIVKRISAKLGEAVEIDDITRRVIELNALRNAIEYRIRALMSDAKSLELLAKKTSSSEVETVGPVQRIEAVQTETVKESA